MQLDGQLSRSLREAGIQRALDFSGVWADNIVAEFREWAVAHKAAGNFPFTIEQFRETATNEPGSHKAWGSLPRILRGADLIERVLDVNGQPTYRIAKSPRTHAHPVALWRLL